MKKTAAMVILLLAVMLPQAYGQHSVNDIKKYNGWFKISIDVDTDNSPMYTVTQCYPNGDEYALNDDERRQLPLWLKVFCMVIFDNTLKDQMERMTFNAGGISMKVMGFNLKIDYSRSDEEILVLLSKAFGQEKVNKYKDSNW